MLQLAYLVTNNRETTTNRYTQAMFLAWEGGVGWVMLTLNIMVLDWNALKEEIAVHAYDYTGLILYLYKEMKGKNNPSIPPSHRDSVLPWTYTLAHFSTLAQ